MAHVCICKQYAKWRPHSNSVHLLKEFSVRNRTEQNRCIQMGSTIKMSFHSFTSKEQNSGNSDLMHTERTRSYTHTVTRLLCLKRLGQSLYFGPKRWYARLNVHVIHQRHTAITKAPSPCLHTNRREGEHVGSPGVVVVPLAGSRSDRL